MPTKYPKSLFRLVLLAVLALFALATPSQAAVSYRSSQCVNATFVWFPPTSLSINRPNNLANGDLMILTMYVDVGAGWSWDTSAPDGWTPLRSSGNAVSYYKIANNEPSSYTVVTGGFSAGKAGATISAFYGVDQGAPFANAGAQSTGSGTTVALPNTTATRSGSMRFSSIAIDAARTVTNPTLTESADCAGNGVGMSGAYQAQGPGSTTAATSTTAGSGNWVAQTYVINPAAPAPIIDSISPNSGPAGSTRSVTITGQYLLGASSVTFGGTAGTSLTVVNDNTITVTAPAKAAGVNEVRVTTGNGTSTDNGASDDYTYVGAPTITSLAPSTGSTAGGTSVTITGTNFIGLSGATAVRFGATNATSYTVNSATSITAIAPAGTGTQNVSVVAAGGTSANTAADDFTYYAPPSVAAIAPSSGPEAGGTTVTITGTNFSGLSGAGAVQFGGTNASSYTVNSATQITATAPAGTGVQDVRVTTPGGMSANTAADDYTYYAIPTITALSPTSGPAGGGTTVTITGTNFAGLSGAAAVRFGATNATSYTVDSATQITATAPAGSGTQDVRVTTPGGTTANSAADDYTYIPAPAVTALSPDAGPTAGATTVTITGTNFTGATQVQFGATNASSYTVDSATQITASAPPGAGTVDVRVSTAGGTSANTAADNYTYHAIPTITALSPTSGPTAGATSVTITGTNFTGLSGAAAVRFGATNAASYTVNSATSITATAPAGAAGTVDVRVTTPGGTTADTSADDYTYVALPTVTALSPSAGPTAGGTTVTITGTNLTGATQVRFGATNATGFTVNSATSITATAPAGAAGAVDVRVTTAGGQSTNTAADDYTYYAAPTITSISPMSGPAPGGTSVTITGTNFTGATAVNFGGSAGTSVNVVNSTTITVTSPSGTGTVDVRVVAPGGTSANTAADDFTYIPAPTVAALSPTSGPAGGGTTVTITGTTFTGATSVTFGGVSASFSVVNGTTITATSPAGSGTADVRVTTPSGTSANTSADDFTYIPAPTVTALSPATGPTAGGTTVTITGTNFSGATQVRFGATNASGFTVNSATSITATAPAGTGTQDVRVTTPGGQSANTAADNYVYADAPVISGIAPSVGPVAGGTIVTITGNFLSGATAVTFGGTAATSFTVVNATTITAQAPAHAAGAVDVRVTTPDGTSVNTGADDFTYVAVPTVTGVAPASGPDVGGTLVTITGTGFTGVSSVTFGGVPALGYSVVNATTITATAPAHAAGNVDIRITTPGGLSANTAADDFTYLSACGAGALNLTTNPVNFLPFTLDGMDHTRSTNTTFAVSDMTGAGLGWKLEVGTTQFSAGPGKTLPANAARITGATSTPLGGSCSSPTSTISSYPVTLPLSPSKATIYNADLNTGRGPVDVGLNVELDVPANAQFGTYQSTWSVDLTAAP